MLADAGAWTGDPRISVTKKGLRVEVATGRTFAIAACSTLKLPESLGRIKVCVSDVGGQCRWFVRLYGELRQPGERHTTGIAQDETAAGLRTFHLDPRFYQLPEAPLQLQLGVEGPPGAHAVFSDVAFLPPVQHANRKGPDAAEKSAQQPGQKPIAAVTLMPNLPEPFHCIDWKAKARAYDRFVFDFNARGDFLPLIWMDPAPINGDATAFGLPSYVGDPHRTWQSPGAQESITCMGAVLGAALVGIDKRRQDHDYVDLCRAWFNSKNGLDLVLNLQRQETGGSFWYEIWPHIIFYALADLHPGMAGMVRIMGITADRWLQACNDLKGKGVGGGRVPDFNITSYNFRTRKPVDNGRWKEPDAAAGVAWLQYAAWKRFGHKKYLAAAEDCLRFLEQCKRNPYYEVLLPYGVLTAARLNAELGRQYDVDRFLNWCFDVSDCRGGWGVIVGNWGGHDCDGLLGSIDNRGGYAFAMNTFAQAAALVPLVRYDARYARAIGKWMLNLAHAARFFYPGALSAGHGSSEFWKGDPEHVIAYEGLRREWQGKSPYATGDPVVMKWGPKTDLGLYGSGHVGMLAAIVEKTDVPRILQLDLCATDFFQDRTYPAYLYFNPEATAQQVTLDVGRRASHVYDFTRHQFIHRNVTGAVKLALPADSAAAVTIVPADGKVERRNGKVLCNGIVIDFRSTSSRRIKAADPVKREGRKTVPGT